MVLLKISEVAKELDIPVSKVRQLADQGELKISGPKNTKHRLFNKEDVQKYKNKDKIQIQEIEKKLTIDYTEEVDKTLLKEIEIHTAKLEKLLKILKDATKLCEAKLVQISYSDGKEYYAVEIEGAEPYHLCIVRMASQSKENNNFYVEYAHYNGNLKTNDRPYLNKITYDEFVKKVAKRVSTFNMYYNI